MAVSLSGGKNRIKEHPVDLQRKAEKRRAREARKRQSELEHRTKSPPPVDGRRHQPVQTELYLEEITDRIEESEAVCQTDAWMDRPPTPLFVPAKTGADVSTQILPGDLFDFDRDVKVKNMRFEVPIDTKIKFIAYFGSYCWKNYGAKYA